MARKRNVGTTNRRTLVASGRKIDITDEGEAQKKKRQAQKWQSDAWRFFHDLGEIFYTYMFIAAALRRGRLVIAIPDEEGGAPKVLTPAEAPDAWDALDRVEASSGGQGAILANLSICLGVVGEGYVVGWHPTDGEEEWDAFSPDQIHGEGDDWYIQTAPGQSVSAMTKLDDDAFVCRVWMRDPQWRDLAMSAMRPLISTCDELLILSRAIRAGAVSRLAGAGMLLVPDEISFGSVDSTEDEGDGGGDSDPLTADLLAVMMTPIEDPTSAAAVVPFIVRGPGEQLHPDKFRHITFDRPIDPEQSKQRSELRTVLAAGLDLPAEQITGAADSNHWNAWLADDQGQDRIETLLTLISAALTSGYLRPALEGTAGAGKDYMVWYDASAIVKHPNLASDAQEALDEAAISYEAYRKAKGFSESDAMDEPGFERWKEVQAAKHAAKPPGQPPVNAETVTKAPPDQPSDTAPTDTPIVASARDRLPVGSELLDLERGVRHKLQVAANMEMTKTLEKIGAKLRRKAGQRGPVADLVRGVDNALVAQALGPKMVEQWGPSFASDQLLTDAFLDLHPMWDGWVTQAQRRIVTIANREGADLSPDDYLLSAEQARTEGWQMLLTGLISLAELRLYDPNPAPPPLGEIDLLSTVPVGIIRGALSRAGGSNGQLADSGAMLVEDSMGRTIAAGGLTTGPDALAALDDAGLNATGWLWSAGGPSRPFEPHQDLDGLDFVDFGDEALAADPGEFPFVSAYAPGDHDGCFPAGTIVSGPAAHGSTLRWYEGELVELSFASGQFLTATPNHPVLTPQGWVGAGLLHEGGDVIRCIDGEGIAALIPDDHQVPAKIEDVAAAVGVTGGMCARGVPVPAEHFHGDGLGSEVCVVRADRQLVDRHHAALGEPTSQDDLVRRSVETEALAGDRGAAECLEAVGASALGGVGGLGSEAPTLGRSVGRGDETLPGHAAQLDAMLVEPLRDRLPTGDDIAGEGLDRLAGLVATDQVVGIRRFPFGGHVYNLQTNTDWYVSDGVIVHNCECDLAPLLDAVEVQVPDEEAAA